MDVKQIVKQASIVLAKNSPAILTGIGLISLGGAVVFSGQATLKAKSIITDLEYDEYLRARGEEESCDIRPVPKIEIVKKVLPVYIPTILMVGISAACMIGSTRISAKRTAVLTGLYSASEVALKEYQAKVIEQIGEKKELKVQDAVVQEHIDQNPVSSNQVIITGKGDSLCYDTWSGRYFYSDYEKVRKAANDVNYDVISEMWVSMNEMYYYLGLQPIEGGSDVGFDVDHRLEFRLSSHLTDDGRPCLALEYRERPRPRF